MLDVLAAAEAALPELLADPAGWRSLDIDYHPPRVERLYRDLDGYRLNLHRAWPCDPGAALIHPHPWPSAMRLVRGRYRMWIGHGAGTATPPLAGLVELAAGSCYAMTERDQWHAVAPVDGPTLSVMVTGAPWDRAMPIEPARPLQPLTAEAREALFEAFRAIYPR